MSDTPVPAPKAIEPISSPEPMQLPIGHQAESNAAGGEPMFVDLSADPTPWDPTPGNTNEPGRADYQPTPVRKVDPMQGMKLEAILHELVAYFGWEEMGYRINIRCFNEDPSIGSSLKFLRKTPWARNKVDALFLTMRAEQSEQSEQAEQGNRAEPTEQAP
jgi:uncharacterized protein (DUF2132 family)